METLIPVTNIHAFKIIVTTVESGERVNHVVASIGFSAGKKPLGQTEVDWLTSIPAPIKAAAEQLALAVEMEVAVKLGELAPAKDG